MNDKCTDSQSESKVADKHVLRISRTISSAGIVIVLGVNGPLVFKDYYNF